MADEETEEQPEKKGAGMGLWLATLLVAAGGGAAVPYLLNTSAPAEEVTEEEGPSPYEMPTSEETAVVPFGDITVNLNDGRMNRYLRLKIAVLVAKDDETMVTEAITSKAAVLKNWMLSHLSDKGLEEIRGTAGLNMLRRELLGEFNDVLFSDHLDHVYDVLFEEFNIQ